MSLDELDNKTAIEKDLGTISTRSGDTLYFKFRFSAREGGSFNMVIAPSRGAARSCTFQIKNFRRFIDVLKQAGDLFAEADKILQKEGAEAAELQEAIRLLTEG